MDPFAVRFSAMNIILLVLLAAGRAAQPEGVPAQPISLDREIVTEI